MNVRELFVLLPCHSLEDFPLYHEGREADGLLAACTALWHPSLIAATRKLPGWHRADIPPEEMAGRLFLVPAVSEAWLTEDLLVQAEAERAVVQRNLHSRAEIVEAVTAHLGEAPPTFSAETIADFFALGFCKLHVELLTRVMRYTSTLDEARLQTDVLAAIDAAIAGDEKEQHDALSRAFETLNEARKYFFPVESYLIDLTLVADTTLGRELRATLHTDVPMNVLLDGKLLDKMAEREPETLDALKDALDRNVVSVVGGEYEEREFPLLPEEVWREDLLKGIATYEKVLGRRPVVYGRRRAGLSPILPQLLCRTGFTAALHFTLDDGQFPTSYEAKVRWDSADGSVVEAIAQVPFDAARPEPLLDFPRRLGESLDREQVPTMVFAHWPSRTSPYYEDLRRVGRYTNALGKFLTLDEYFSHTITAGNYANFRSDDYRTPYLQQAVAARSANPISQIADPAHAANCAAELETLDVLSHLITGNERAEWDDLAFLLSRGGSKHEGLVLFNTCSTPITSCDDYPTKYEVDGPITSSDPISNSQRACLTASLPAVGFVWTRSTDATTASPARKKRIVNENVLRNDFFEVTIHPETGAIHSIHEYGARGNILTQQIALRSQSGQTIGGVWQNPDALAVYSRMIAESSEVTTDTTGVGEIMTRGRLVDEAGVTLAKFRQTTAVIMGSPIVRLEIELEPVVLPSGTPWENYYAARFAFPDRELEFFGNIGLARVACNRARLEASRFVEVVDGPRRVAILPRGLPYHRRVHGRTLDTLLVVNGESKRNFFLGIAVGVEQPATAAQHFDTPVWDRVVPNSPDKNTSGWFFHIDARNVVATQWESVGVKGFRVRLRETMELAGRVCLRSFRKVKTARQTDFLGNTLLELRVEDDKIWMDVAAQEWIQVEAMFEG